jgi:hypothetical protein
MDAFSNEWMSVMKVITRQLRCDRVLGNRTLNKGAALEHSSILLAFSLSNRRIRAALDSLYAAISKTPAALVGAILPRKKEKTVSPKFLSLTNDNSVRDHLQGSLAIIPVFMAQTMMPRMLSHLTWSTVRFLSIHSILCLPLRGVILSSNDVYSVFPRLGPPVYVLIQIDRCIHLTRALYSTPCLYYFPILVCPPPPSYCALYLTVDEVLISPKKENSLQSTTFSAAVVTNRIIVEALPFQL